MSLFARRCRLEFGLAARNLCQPRWAGHLLVLDLPTQNITTRPVESPVATTLQVAGQTLTALPAGEPPKVSAPVVLVTVLLWTALREVSHAAAGRQDYQVILCDVAAGATGRQDLDNHGLAGSISRKPLHLIAFATIRIVLALVVGDLDSESIGQIVRDGDGLVVIAEVCGTASRAPSS